MNLPSKLVKVSILGTSNPPISVTIDPSTTVRQLLAKTNAPPDFAVVGARGCLLHDHALLWEHVSPDDTVALSPSFVVAAITAKTKTITLRPEGAGASAQAVAVTIQPETTAAEAISLAGFPSTYHVTNPRGGILAGDDGIFDLFDQGATVPIAAKFTVGGLAKTLLTFARAATETADKRFLLNDDKWLAASGWKERAPREWHGYLRLHNDTQRAKIEMSSGMPYLYLYRPPGMVRGHPCVHPRTLGWFFVHALDDLTIRQTIIGAEAWLDDFIRRGVAH